MRKLTAAEQKNADVVESAVGAIGLLHLTRTGLNKSILDATGSVRRYLRALRIHDYGRQEQGPENRVSVDARLVGTRDVVPTTASLYRPRTKGGDPRIWFRGLRDFAEADDLIGVFVAARVLHVVNLSRNALAGDLAANRNNSGLEVLGALMGQTSAAAGRPFGRRRKPGDKRLSTAQGRLPSGQRQAVEMRAMDVVHGALQALGYTVKDVHLSRPWDLEARLPGRRVTRIEVKGTTGHGQALVVTTGEVNSALSGRRTMLAVVSRIHLNTAAPPRASGGTVSYYGPWRPRESELVAATFSWTAREHESTTDLKRAMRRVG